MLDSTGVMIVLVGLAAFGVRVTKAIITRQKIRAAITEHHSKASEADGQSNYQRVRDAVSAIPVKLRIGLSFGALSFLIGLAPMALRSALPEALMPENTLGRTLWLTAKWCVLGTALQAMRKWGVQHLKDQRARAHAHAS